MRRGMGFILAALALSSWGWACAAATPAIRAPEPRGPAEAIQSRDRKPTTVQEIALYQGDDRQQVLEAGARAEGQVMLFTSGLATQFVRPLSEAFQAKYPFVKVEVFRGDEQELVQRVQTEYAAGRYEVDIWETSRSGLVLPRQTGLLQKIYSPHLAMMEDDARDPDGLSVGVRESYISVGYNTELVRKEEAPRSYQDLLDPKWKGKMSIAGSTTGVRWTGNLVTNLGEDFLRRLAQQDIRVQNISGRALADMIIAGEVPLSPTIFDSHVNNSKEKGAPIEWVPLEPVTTTMGSVALASKSPRPHAAMLFIDFLLSLDGQKIYAATGYGSPRLDVGGRVTYRKFIPEKQPDFIRSFESWQRLMRSTFIRGQ